MEMLFSRLTQVIFPADCMRCGVEGDWLCKDCRKRTGLDGVASAFETDNAVLERLFKIANYQNQADALRYFTTIHRTKLLRALPDKDWTFSFVPLSRDRFAKRGFNQAEL